MNNLKRILVLLTALVLVFSLASCGDKSAAIKKAFEKEGWTVTTVNTEDTGVKTVLKIMLTDEQIEKVSEYEIIFCAKSITKSAVVIKFPSAGDVKDFLTVEKDGKKDSSAYDQAKKDGNINGNCLLISLSSDAKEIFK